MKRILLLVLAMNWVTGHAQEIVAELHLERKEPQPLWFEYVRADGGLATLSYMTKKSSRYIGIFKYDSQFQRSWRKQFLQNTIRNEVIHFSVLGERIYVFVGIKEPGRKSRGLYLFAYDLEGNPIYEQQRIAETEAKGNLRDIFQFKKSTNRNILLCLQEHAGKDNDELRYTSIIFSKYEEGYATQTFSLPYAHKALSLKQLEISSSGVLHLLGKRKIIDDGLDKARFSLFTVRQEVEETPLYFFENVITDMIFKIAPNEEIFLGGFYSRKYKDQAYGLVYARLDSADRAMTVHTFLPFGKAFLSKYLNRRQMERGRELTDYYLDDILLRSDGGMLFLAEQFYISYVNAWDPGGFSTTRTTYNYLDIATFSVSKEGELEWQKVIDKAQSSESKIELGYFSAVGPSGMYFFFKEYYKGTKMNIYYVRMGLDGEKEQPQAFLPGFKGRDTFYRTACEQITNSQAVLVYEKGGVFSLIKLQL